MSPVAPCRFLHSNNFIIAPWFPDLLIFHKCGWWWWHEVKRLQGPRYKTVAYGQTEYQKQFQVLVEAAGHRYLCGSRDVAIEILQEVGALGAFTVSPSARSAADRQTSDR